MTLEEKVFQQVLAELPQIMDQTEREAKCIEFINDLSNAELLARISNKLIGVRVTSVYQESNHEPA